MSESTISHPGIITKIEGSKAEVTVQVNSGCASCEIKGSCSISESVAKIIEVDLENAEMYCKGQLVSVEMKQSQGSWAVVFGYLFPFVVLVASLVVFISLGIDEGISGLLALGMLVPYYLVLYLLRNYFKKKFSYRLV
ncbi:MAG TPA: SoxR reducing system RseC family protein [Bacteroidales bacterium]